MALPNGTNCSPNLSMSFSPAKKPTTPPLFGSVVAISASALPAVAALETRSASIPLMALLNSAMLSPNGTSSSAKSEREELPVNQDAIPCTSSAFVSSNIASVNACTPLNIAGEILLAPSING